MPLRIIREDITKISVDAIVNAANGTLLGGGGVDGAIHAAAGPLLLQECKTLGGCKTGDAKITKGYLLPSKYVIHTVGPIWNGGTQGEKDLLVSCYKKSLDLVKQHGLQSVAFPLISAGAYGYPKDQALKVAMDVITQFLLENDILIYLVVFDKDSFEVSGKLFDNIRQYIDDLYVEQNCRNARRPEFYSPRKVFDEDEDILSDEYPASLCRTPFRLNSDKYDDFPDLNNVLDESFAEMLFRKIDEKGITDAQCYNRANIDRKLFSKIRNNRDYHPRKQTVLALAVALELPLSETAELLAKAGFALSHSNKFDIIVEYFISNGKYNIYEINEILFAFDQKLLGL